MNDSNGAHDFIWDGENILLDLDAAATWAAYTHSPQGYGHLISQRRSGATAFHHYDALGSTDRLTDSNEAVSVSYLYKAFGEQSVLSGSHTNPFTWVGKLGYYRQPDPADYWLRARVYEDGSGRFLSRDPAMDEVNLYRYVRNRPLVLIDPAGLQCSTPDQPCWGHRRGTGMYAAMGPGGPGGGMGRGGGGGGGMGGGGMGGGGGGRGGGDGGGGAGGGGRRETCS